MKITTKIIDPSYEEEIIIKTYDETSDWVQYVKNVKEEVSFIGMKEDRYYKIPMKDIYYFESVDGKTFLYAQKSVYQSKLKLYEIEENYSNPNLFRVSKSMIVNLKKVKHIRPALSGRFEIELSNNEMIMVNRHYVSQLKTKLGL